MGTTWFTPRTPGTTLQRGSLSLPLTSHLTPIPGTLHPWWPRVSGSLTVNPYPHTSDRSSKTTFYPVGPSRVRHQ